MRSSRKPVSSYVDKSGNPRPPRGIRGKLCVPVHNPKEEVHPADKDRDNRRTVLKTIDNLINEGKTKEEAFDIICSNEEIKSQFAYFEKNGLDFRKIVEQWYTSYVKTINSTNTYNKFPSER